MKKKKILAMGLVLALTAVSFLGCAKEEKEVFNRVEVNSSEEALTLLKEGNERYNTGKSMDANLSQEKRDELKEGQNPFAVVVSCSDSRVVVPHIFNQGLGDIFEIKLAGNIASDEALGSIEYAVDHLGTPLIVVLGHESCGAVSSTVDAKEGGDSSHESHKDSKVNTLVEAIAPCYETVKKNNKDTEDIKELVCDENIKSVTNEVLKNPVIKEKVEKGELKVVSAKYLLSGQVQWQE